MEVACRERRKTVWKKVARDMDDSGLEETGQYRVEEEKEV